MRADLDGLRDVLASAAVHSNATGAGSSSGGAAAVAALAALERLGMEVARGRAGAFVYQRREQLGRVRDLARRCARRPLPRTLCRACPTARARPPAADVKAASGASSTLFLKGWSHACRELKRERKSCCVLACVHLLAFGLTCFVCFGVDVLLLCQLHDYVWLPHCLDEQTRSLPHTTQVRCSGPEHTHSASTCSPSASRLHWRYNT